MGGGGGEGGGGEGLAKKAHYGKTIKRVPGRTTLSTASMVVIMIKQRFKRIKLSKFVPFYTV